MDEYKDYMESEVSSYDRDKRIISKIYSHCILVSEELHSCLEEQSIYWNDDVEFIISMILKTIKRYRDDSGKDFALMPMYRSEEDKRFVKKLFRKAVEKDEEYKSLIGKYTKNWEVERIAFMDILIMQLCVTEVVEFNDIPTKVSFNEYLEISKYYSTPRSSHFINGILDKIINELKKDKIIVKKGRGLVGEDS
jgi:N utilization substance protein B